MNGTRGGALPAAGSWVDQVAAYYDSNTRRFLVLGSGRGVHSLHRELWGPGVRSPREAAQWIDRALGDEIAAASSDAAGASPVILDFGCGVGGTLFHLAARFSEARLAGITVSARQVEIARRLATEHGLAERCSFALGDFHTTDLGLRADAIVAVESFAHSGDVDAFLANAARHLRPDGSLIITDDFLAEDPDSLDARWRRRVEELREGWRVPAVSTVERLEGAAALHGLATEKVVDLTPLTRPGSRARDRLLRAFGPSLARLGLAGIPFWGNMIGGHALQVGLRKGFIRYLFVVLRKGAPAVSRGASGH
jgi:SAM-dependent methyltransferase